MSIRKNFGSCIICNRIATKRGYCASHYCTAVRQGVILTTPIKRILPSNWQPDRELLAWAAGFMDGEGSFYVIKSKTCKSGFLPYVSACQSGEPSLLYKIQCAMGGLGKVSKPRLIDGKKPAYKWDAGGHEQVQFCLALLWPWLGEVKRTAGVTSLKRSR